MEEVHTNNSLKKIPDILLKYIVPFVSLIVGLVLAWSALSSNVNNNAQAIELLNDRVYNNEKTINIVLQRLEGIDAKLEYIIKDIDNR